MTQNETLRILPKAKFFFEGEKKFFVKGVTYGPFKPDADGNYVGWPEQADADLALMRDAGLNVVRIYHSPPRWFLDRCAAAGMRVLVTLPWEKHIEFLRERSTRKQIAENVRAAVKAHAGHPAIFGYLVGNEISSTMARWLGTSRVIEFVEELIRIGRAIDPDALFSYATYPPTEYLLPQNSDFSCFNVYLHNQRDFEGYLLRLQNLTGEHPLILGEFGMDTIRHSQDEQAEMLGWHIDSVVKCGLAGTILFTWTDEWFTGGQEITDWAFGLVTRERKPKKAFYTIQEKLGGNNSTSPHLSLPKTPFVSVIVCSYNGGHTLPACLDSLGKLNYPAYEVILVDDGSTDDTAHVAAQFPWVRYIHQTNHGLSYARNAGAGAAKGEVLAYTDSDCMADVDWLYYLIGTLVSGDYAGVGGPNITPPAQNWIQACVAGAPGGPNHVLLTDTVAEHIPGCNMAFYRWAFEAIGGFDPEYRKAGDDVDFCWRIQQTGWVISFSPTAIVWHYRRFTLRAFLKQQDGYGEAESLLRFKHLIFFGPTGTAKWRGQIYGTTRFSWFVNRPIIYHGIFGEGFFQSIYPAPQSEVAAYLSSIEWFALDDLSFWPGNFSAWAAHCSVPDARWHLLRGAFVHGCGRGSNQNSTRCTRACSLWSSRLCNLSCADSPGISPGCVSNAHRQTSSGSTNICPNACAREVASAGVYFGASRGGTAIISWAKCFGCWRKKAGAIPPTAAGTTGIFKFTAISGGASHFKPSPNITAQGSV